MNKRTYKVSFTRYEVKNEHVEYIVKVINTTGNEEFSILDRYKTMRGYWEDMTSKHGEAVPSKFPPKKFFGNKDPKFIKQRMKELEEYFNALLSDPNLAESPITQRYFLKKKLKDTNEIPLPPEESKTSPNSNSIFPQIISDKMLKHIVDRITKSYIDIGFGEESPPFEDANKKTLEYSSVLTNQINSIEYASRLLALPKAKEQSKELSLELINNENILSEWLNNKMGDIMRIIEEQGIEIYDDKESILSVFKMNL